MASSTPAQGNIASEVSRPTPEDIKNEFVFQRVKRWRTKQKKIRSNQLGLELGEINSEEQPGCLLSGNNGGYVYVPYDDDRKDLPPNLRDRILQLERWASNPANSVIMRQVDKLLEDEVSDKCWFEFLDGGDASQVDFHGKVKMLAKYYLMKIGPYLSPEEQPSPQLQFLISDITEFGHVDMKWFNLSWTCTEEEVVERLEGYSCPSYRPETVVPRQLKELECIHHPEGAFNQAQAMIQELLAQRPVENEPSWSYFLCDNTGHRHIEEQQWIPLGGPKEFRTMKQEARRRGMRPVLIRPWQRRHYTLCKQIQQLQQYQFLYCQQLDRSDENNRRPFDATGLGLFSSLGRNPSTAEDMLSSSDSDN
ncbi:hypothetical protein VTK56DRAFT_8235 [Thermocarpiscus australiensis]